jgi:hypothetical protein
LLARVVIGYRGFIVDEVGARRQVVRYHHASVAALGSVFVALRVVPVGALDAGLAAASGGHRDHDRG